MTKQVAKKVTDKNHPDYAEAGTWNPKVEAEVKKISARLGKWDRPAYGGARSYTLLEGEE